MANNLIFKRHGLPPKRKAVHDQGKRDPKPERGHREGGDQRLPERAVKGRIDDNSALGQTGEHQLGVQQPDNVQGEDQPLRKAPFDRNEYHKTYMKEYMRKRRAKLKEQK